MRSNPLVTEVLAGLPRQGKAQLDHLGVLLLQAVAVLLWWPREGVMHMLESQAGPNTLTALVVAFGLGSAYIAMRLGAEEILLPGQHGLRDWSLATPLPLGRILRGYLIGQLVHSLHLLALSSPFILMAFTVSGGEWTPLGWCLAAALVQALFYRLCGALVHLSVGEHPGTSRLSARTILVVLYVPIGYLVHSTSHVALTLHALGDDPAMRTAWSGLPPHLTFIALYATSSLLAAAAVYWLLLRARRATLDPRRGARLGEGAVS